MPPTLAAAPSQNADRIDAVIETARAQLGKPYQWGAEGPNAFDCSGLMQYAFGAHGVQLPRVSADQAKAGVAVPLSDLARGDLIFTSWDGSPDVDHVALYLGNGEYIHAPRPGKPVQIGKITDSYRAHILGVRRVIGHANPGNVGSIGGALSGALSGAGGGLVDAVKEGAGALKTMADATTRVGDLAGKAMWLALPTTQVRIWSGVVGVMFVGLGVYFISKAAR
jgi:hypothetical protein